MEFYSVVLLVVTIAAVNSAEVEKTVPESLEKLNKGELRYVISVLKDGVQTDVVDSGARDESFKDFAEKLSKYDDPRYGMIDYEYQENGSPVTKRVLLLWNPEAATPEAKKIYRDAYNEKHAAAAGADYFVEFNKKSELTDENLVAKLKATLPISEA